jgi:peptide/nickel transport system substrate-binding protein
MKKTLLVLAFSAAAAAVAFAGGGQQSGGAAPAAASTGKTVSTAVVNAGINTAWDTLNPYDSASGSTQTQIIWDKIYDRLAFSSQGGAVIRPRAADSWEGADGGKAVIFHLNKNAKWHDGVPVTARDWVFTVNLISNKDLTLNGSGYFRFLTGTDSAGKALSPGSVGVQAVDDYTLKFTLKDVTLPESFLVLYNRNFYVLPEHILSAVPVSGIKTADLWKKPIGSGPNVFVSEIVGSQIIFKSNDAYHLGRPGYGELHYTVIASANLLSSFIAGDLDYTNGISVDESTIAKASGFTVVNSKAQNGFTEIILNNTNISDPRIRQALHYALDKNVLSQVSTQGLGKPSFSSVLPSSEYYNNSLTISRDVAKAKSLLAAAGYNGKEYTIAIGQSRAELFAVVQQQWAEVGIKTKIIVVDVATMFTGLTEGKYDIGVSGHTATAEPLWFANQFSAVSANYFGVTDPVYDAKADEIRATLDTAKRKQLILDYQAFIADRTPFIPLWHSGSLFAQSKTVKNIDQDAYGLCNENTWEWVKD